jgi:hypothetical protein
MNPFSCIWSCVNIMLYIHTYFTFIISYLDSFGSFPFTTLWISCHTVDLLCHKVLELTVFRYVCVCLFRNRSHSRLIYTAIWKQSPSQSVLAGSDYNLLYQQLVIWVVASEKRKNGTKHTIPYLHWNPLARTSVDTLVSLWFTLFQRSVRSYSKSFPLYQRLSFCSMK